MSAVQVRYPPPLWDVSSVWLEHRTVTAEVRDSSSLRPAILLASSSMAELSAVNRAVGGSSPLLPAISNIKLTNLKKCDILEV